METTNNFKPILFSTEMVQAILAGRKTQTRRVLKLKTPVDIAGVEVDCYLRLDLIPTNMQVFYANKKDKQINLYSDNEYAKYKPGDILWVRESATIFKVEGITGFHRSGEKPVGYKSIQKIGIKYINGERIEIYYPERLSLNIKCGNKLSNGVFKEAARIFLKVTNVRCERLQEISKEDAIAEGLEIVGTDREFIFYKNYQFQGEFHQVPRNSFLSLWDSINAKKHPWESNPWVWVYEFERIEKPENFK